MSNNIGNKVADIKADQAWQPITQVKVKVDQSNTFTAGTTTGRTFEVECPIGSQAVADNLLAALNGYVYKAYEATDALIKPTIELGQSVSVGDVYSIVGGIHIKGDMILAANLSAPGSGDIDHEYPYDKWKRIIVDAKNIRHGGGHGTVSGAAITDLTVVNTKIAPLAIEAAKIADGAVEGPKIANWAVTAAKIADAAVETPKLYDGAVTTPKIGGSAVTNEKCSSTVNQSLADADYSADVFSGAATASYTKATNMFCYGTFDIEDTFLYKGVNISLKTKNVLDSNGSPITIKYLGSV